MLLDNAFGNYRNVLKKVALSPVMGDFLNNANNDKAAPNENFARELLQLFSIGTCELNADGTPAGRQLHADLRQRDGAQLRLCADRLDLPGRRRARRWGCWPKGTNCRYYGGDMVPRRDAATTPARARCSPASRMAAGTDAAQALERVLDSLMAHPNIGAVHRQAADPAPGRRATRRRPTCSAWPRRFNSGRFGSDGRSFGTGQRGDLAATVGGDPARRRGARRHAAPRSAGRLREPVLMFTGVLRALERHRPTARR